MTGFGVITRALAVLGEALRAGRSQKVASTVSVLMVAGMCAIVLLTTGRTVGAESAVLDSLDAAGTRSIIVRAEPGAGVDSTVIDRLQGVSGIEWVAAFGAGSEVSNAGVPGATTVPWRKAWLPAADSLGVRTGPVGGVRAAWASSRALEVLGMPDNLGAVLDGDGIDHAIGGPLVVPEFLDFLEPLVVSTQAADQVDEISVLVVTAVMPEQVESVRDVVESVLGSGDTTKVRISTSEALAQLRQVLQGSLGTFGRGLVTVVFGATALLVGTILYGLSMLRRRDFGRRRALGATRSLIVALLVGQMAILSLIGALVGSVAAVAGLALSGDPLPGVRFFVSVGFLAITISCGAASVPAWLAARRDPIRELRVA
ncbi:lipoprotein ABC transporter permease [Nakamurella silvestris]|nr:lipoprotein ABC transporter permease [Nakamurella silvestris]